MFTRGIGPNRQHVSDTRHHILLGSVGDIGGMGYTAFGVTAVNDHTAIYDLLPVAVQFADRVVLRMKSVVPLLIDREAKTVTFAIASAPRVFERKGPSGVDIAELTLSGSTTTAISVSGNKVRIELRNANQDRDHVDETIRLRTIGPVAWSNPPEAVVPDE